MSNAAVLVIKIGQVEQLTFDDGTTYESAIRKQPVARVKVRTLGAEGNEVGLKKHHGGVDKALFFMSSVSFSALNNLLNENFSYRGTAIYGENVVVSGFDEDSVCVGDRFKIGSTLVEVSQPRKPCERLSKNTNHRETQKIVHQSGWTGWYVRVIEEGEITQGDELILQHRPYPQFTIRALNRLLSASPSAAALEQALTIDELAEAFKRSLRSQLTKTKRKND
ncbi:MOSC domain-containing protein [Rodentibacter myodis]|uniref:Molybdenum cofactor sulfurase n=1 Tax=Rodentibacter myodis TaxID=1907939 RepID=A0A1V3JLB5_9PAST|nr:MOSC domain-containing protein [Rodentibacter myodis]OOF57448.1 molybdenum cofactor sulfurase [Rodentibacter myodis]